MGEEKEMSFFFKIILLGSYIILLCCNYFTLQLLSFLFFLHLSLSIWWYFFSWLGLWGCGRDVSCGLWVK